MGFMSPMQSESLGRKKYVFVYVDDCSRFTWISFLRSKAKTAKVCTNLYHNLQHEQGKNIVRICSDHNKEFENEEFDTFCEKERIRHKYSTPLTPKKKKTEL